VTLTGLRFAAFGGPAKLQTTWRSRGFKAHWLGIAPAFPAFPPSMAVKCF
jgi:hypothetical protein